MSKIIIAGGTGFIGREILRILKEKGIESVVLSRSSKPAPGADRTVVWNGRDQGDWTKELNGALGVINLSGKSIMTLFTPDAKRELLESRVQPTQAIAEALASMNEPPSVWVNASAMGFYGDAGSRVLEESAPRGEGFLAELCAKWEGAMDTPATPKTRKVIVRVSMVLGQGGGAFDQLSRVTKAFAGGAIGSGGQWVSWIHVEDMARMFVWAVENPDVSGVLNGASPHPVTNSDLMAAFRSAYGRPFVPPAPPFMLRLMAPLTKVEPEILLSSMRLSPVMPLAKGFEYRYPLLAPALDQLVGE